ncbi:MAG: putative metal-binding motif-containing protein [Methylococcaceae bacterium]|nr:putative metal-binding motif-containing protein [Methylococcaceae bacterium]
MNSTHRYTLLAAGIVAALPELAAAQGGTHSAMAAAHLSYAETYTERLKGGQELGSELLVLNGHFQFNEQVGIADLSPNTNWKVMVNGSPLAGGMLNDAAKKKFGAKSGMATVVLPNGGTLNFTWNQKAITFVLKWKGNPAIAESFKDKTAAISLPQAAIDVSIGGLQGYFNVQAQGKAKARVQKGVTLSNVALKGNANSAGLNTLDRDADTYTADVDCNDFASTVHPGAKEATLDGVDSNCDGRDSGVPEVVDIFSLSKGSAYTSTAVSFKFVGDLNTGKIDYSGTLRDFTGWNKTFFLPSIGKRSFYDPTTGTKYNDDTLPDTQGNAIWRGWTHTGKWAFFNGKSGDKINIRFEPAATVTAPGVHPGFVLFWRPEGAPLTWEGTADIAAGQTVPANSDIVPAHTLPQRADWTIQGLPTKTDHTAGVDTSLYPMKNDRYTLYYVDSGYDADTFTANDTFMMHPSALKDLAVIDGTPGTLSRAVTLPKTGYYLMYVGNVLELASWSMGADGRPKTVGEVVATPTDISVTMSPQ